jgi:hypothetical protein
MSKKMRMRRRTKSEYNQQTINQYMMDTGAEVIDMTEVAAWAIKTGRWTPFKYDPVKVCARELSRAAREELYRDPQGRDVRKKHCFTVTLQPCAMSLSASGGSWPVAT